MRLFVRCLANEKLQPNQASFLAAGTFLRSIMIMPPFLPLFRTYLAGEMFLHLPTSDIISRRNVTRSTNLIRTHLAEEM
jgi:hypothetical protein